MAVDGWVEKVERVAVGKSVFWLWGLCALWGLVEGSRLGEEFGPLLFLWGLSTLLVWLLLSVTATDGMVVESTWTGTGDGEEDWRDGTMNKDSIIGSRLRRGRLGPLRVGAASVDA